MTRKAWYRAIVSRRFGWLLGYNIFALGTLTALAAYYHAVPLFGLIVAASNIILIGLVAVFNARDEMPVREAVRTAAEKLPDVSVPVEEL